MNSKMQEAAIVKLDWVSIRSGDLLRRPVKSASVMPLCSRFEARVTSIRSRVGLYIFLTSSFLCHAETF